MHVEIREKLRAKNSDFYIIIEVCYPSKSVIADSDVAREESEEGKRFRAQALRAYIPTHY